jgi:hypothetical protein
VVARDGPRRYQPRRDPHGNRQEHADREAGHQTSGEQHREVRRERRDQVGAGERSGRADQQGAPVRAHPDEREDEGGGGGDAGRGHRQPCRPGGHPESAGDRGEQPDRGRLAGHDGQRAEAPLGAGPMAGSTVVNSGYHAGI